VTRRTGAAALAFAGCLLLPSCSPAPREVAQDPSAVKQEYLDLTQKAMAEVRAWSSADGSVADPRPVWAERLERFAAAHPGAPEAAEALSGVMQMRAALLDTDGFFKTYDLMLRTCPDAAAVAGVFPQVSAMRMAEAGGRAAIESMDYGIKQRAWRRAAPGIVADMQRAMKATKTASTIAAAEFTIALSWYRFDVDLRKALEHFKIVAEQYPTSANAEASRGYIDEIERLGPGHPAPDFETVSIDGAKASLSSLRGKIVLLDFWATWCQPCMNELPGLKRAYERFHAEGFTIVGVSADTDKAALNRFVAKERMRWPVIVADASGLGPADPIFRAYNVQAIPMSYLIDRSGLIRGRALFGAEVERTVGELIEK
jgi:peroxiredoxin